MKMAEMAESMPDLENKSEDMAEEKCPMCGSVAKAHKGPKTLDDLKKISMEVSMKRPMRK